MVISCSAIDCSNRYGEKPGLGFFRFPCLPAKRTWGGGGSLLYEEKIGSPANIRESAENTSFQVSRA